MVRKRNRLIGLVVLILPAGLAGCASVVPMTLREQARPVPFSMLRQAPEQYAGTLVLLGGEVIALRSRGEWMEIEVLERPLGLRDRPRLDVAPRGRFAIWIRDEQREANLDTLRSGRLVTVAGEVYGRPTSHASDSPEVLVVLVAKHLHVWPPPFFPGSPRIGIEFGYQGSVGL
jgi:outer membrane lipoprotein